MLCLRDVMSIEPDALHIDTRVGAVAARLARRPGQPVTVVDGFGRLVGALTETDLLRARSNQDTCAALIDGAPCTLDASTSLEQVLREHLPFGDRVIVATHQGRPIGTLGTRDLVRMAQHVLPGHTRVCDLAPATPFVLVDAQLDAPGIRARMAVAGASLAILLRGNVAVAVIHEEELVWAIRSGQDPLGGSDRRIVFPVNFAAPARRAAHDLIRTRARGLPVLGANGEIAAVLTPEDLVGALRIGLESLAWAAVA